MYYLISRHLVLGVTLDFTTFLVGFTFYYFLRNEAKVSGSAGSFLTLHKILKYFVVCHLTDKWSKLGLRHVVMGGVTIII